MTQHFLGTKLTEAYEALSEKQSGKYPPGSPGYNVVYPDGYQSWSPKEVFEKAYYPVGANYPLKLNKKVVENYISSIDYWKCSDHSMIGLVTLRNGFTFSVFNGCVNGSEFSEEYAKKDIQEKALAETWRLLGFILRWASEGNSFGEGDQSYAVILDINEVAG